jgi:hypothetical protein
MGTLRFALGDLGARGGAFLLVGHQPLPGAFLGEALDALRAGLEVELERALDGDAVEA